MDRRFRLDYEIPEARFRALLESIVTSPLAPKVAALIQQRLGRPLEPHDVWYAGFSARSRFPEAKLDALTRKKYPTPEAYAKDMPRLLRQLGFTSAKARWLAEHIVVDPARLAGVDWMRREIDGFVGYVKGSPAADGAKPVLVPGDPERQSREERRRVGVPLDVATWEALVTAGAALGVTRARAEAVACPGRD